MYDAKRYPRFLSLCNSSGSSNFGFLLWYCESILFLPLYVHLDDDAVGVTVLPKTPHFRPSGYAKSICTSVLCYIFCSLGLLHIFPHISLGIDETSSEFRTRACVVEKAIGVPHAEFDELKRHTGGYVANEDMFIENYLPFLEDPYKCLFRLKMMAINQLNKRIRHDQPLVDFANQVVVMENVIDMNAMAKLALNSNFLIILYPPPTRQSFTEFHRQICQPFSIKLQLPF